MSRWLILLIVCILMACHQKSNQPSFKKGTFSLDTFGQKFYHTNSGDSEMTNAFNDAKQNLYLFDNALKSNNKSYTDFAVQMPIIIKNKGELIWINKIETFGESYKGVIESYPNTDKEVKFGDAVFVAKKDISDWMYLDKDTLHGGYTVRVQLKHMTPNEKADFIKNTGYIVRE